MRGLCALGLLLGLVLPSQAMAGPWTKTLGEYYTKLAADFYSSTSYVHPETGEEVEGLAYLGQQYSFFLEAGLLRRWPLQLSAQLPLTIGTTRFPDESIFAEGEVGVARSRGGSRAQGGRPRGRRGRDT